MVIHVAGKQKFIEIKNLISIIFEIKSRIEIYRKSRGIENDVIDLMELISGNINMSICALSLKDYYMALYVLNVIMHFPFPKI